MTDDLEALVTEMQAERDAALERAEQNGMAGGVALARLVECEAERDAAQHDLDALLANGPDVRIWLEYKHERDAARAALAELAQAAKDVTSSAPIGWGRSGHPHHETWVRLYEARQAALALHDEQEPGT
jgi:hypothetical protein